jgi:hypothetical protein
MRIPDWKKGISWKTLGWEKVYERVIKDLGRIPSCGEEEYTGKLLHRKKSFSISPSPAGMLLTKLSLGGNNDVIYKIFPPRESLVSDIPAGDGNIEKLFLQCAYEQVH